MNYTVNAIIPEVCPSFSLERGTLASPVFPPPGAGEGLLCRCCGGPMGILMSGLLGDFCSPCITWALGEMRAAQNGKLHPGEMDPRD